MDTLKVRPDYAVAIENIIRGQELKSKFFFHWSILSGATFTLILPYLNSLENTGRKIVRLGLLKYALVGLLISLIFSSLRNLADAKITYEQGYDGLKLRTSNLKNKLTFVLWAQRIAIAAYILSLIALYIFVSGNIGQ